MSKPKGILVIELPEVPEDCYHCNQIDGTAGYCEHVGKFVDHFVKPGERYPICPIREMPEEDKKDYTPLRAAVKALQDNAVEFELFGICSDYVPLDTAIQVVIKLGKR